MNEEAKIRLCGLNNLLLDLFGKDILISEILKESGLTEYQVERIRIAYLNEYLKRVNQNIYYLVRGVLSERYGKILKFCYYFDGKEPKSNKSLEENYKNKLNRIYQLQAESITRLKKIVRLPLFKNILITAAKDVLKNEKNYGQNYIQKKKRRNLIKKSAQKIQNKQRNSYVLPPRPPTALSEERKAEILKKLYSKKNQRVPARVIEHHEPDGGRRLMHNPWQGHKRYKSNWW